MSSSSPESVATFQAVFYLSYSQWKMFNECPLKFGFAYPSPEGNTNPKPVATTSSRIPENSAFGSSIGYISEWFYTNFWWSKKDPLKLCLDAIPDAIRAFIHKYEKNHGPIDPETEARVWTDTSELLKTHIPGMLNIIKKNELLSENSNSEVDLSTLVKHNRFDFSLKMAGRADFIHYKSDSDVWIIDGKGTMTRESGVDPKQLIWYACQHYVKYGIIPSRLGFAFWAFPDDPMSWVVFDETDMKKLMDSAFNTAIQMKTTKYEPKESVNCLRCEFSGSCPSGTEYISTLRKARNANSDNGTFLIGDV